MTHSSLLHDTDTKAPSSFPFPFPVATQRRLRLSRRLVMAPTLIAGLGEGTALWLPRGPVTTTQALTILLASVVAGTGAGWLLRSRWAMLLAPVT